MSISRPKRHDRVATTTELQVRQSMLDALTWLQSRGLDDCHTATLACRWSRSGGDGLLVLQTGQAGRPDPIAIEWMGEPTVVSPGIPDGGSDEEHGMADTRATPDSIATRLILSALQGNRDARCALASTPRHVTALATRDDIGLPAFHPAMHRLGAIACLHSPIVEAALSGAAASGTARKATTFEEATMPAGRNTAQAGHGSHAREGSHAWMVANWGLVVTAPAPREAATVTAQIEAFAAIECTRRSMPPR